MSTTLAEIIANQKAKDDKHNPEGKKLSEILTSSYMTEMYAMPEVAKALEDRIESMSCELESIAEAMKALIEMPEHQYTICAIHEYLKNGEGVIDNDS